MSYFGRYRRLHRQVPTTAARRCSSRTIPAGRRNLGIPMTRRMTTAWPGMKWRKERRTMGEAPGAALLAIFDERQELNG
jgi:hypothetical protein